MLLPTPINILFELAYNLKFTLLRLLQFLIDLKSTILIYICIPITFNNPLKVCFSNKKNTITI